MTILEAEKIFDQLSNTKCESLRDDLIDLAVRYARIRVDWLLMDPKERGEIEASRSRAHNALIDACDILSRNMAAEGEDNSWRAALGNDRKIIGDFGCYIHYKLGMQAR